jgi:hypothetical protein
LIRGWANLSPALHAARNCVPESRLRLTPACAASGLLLAIRQGMACHKGLTSSEVIRLSFGPADRTSTRKCGAASAARRAAATLSLAERPATSLGMRIRILVLERRRPGGTRPFRIKGEGLCHTSVHHLRNPKGLRKMRGRFRRSSGEAFGPPGQLLRAAKAGERKSLLRRRATPS